MSELSDWVQSNWFELGSLLVQCAVLATLAWYGSKVLRILRVTAGHNKALQRLSLPDLPPEQPTTRQAFTPPQLESVGRGSGEGSAGWNGFIAWLKEPMGSDGIHSQSRVIRWLQSPIGS